MDWAGRARRRRYGHADRHLRPAGRADKYKRAADQRAGAYSILTGIAANRSMATKSLVVVDDLVKQVGRPDYTDMPSRVQPIPLPVGP